jgi:hypothetical protein
VNFLKGTAVDFIKTKFGSNPALEKPFLDSLDADLREVYDTILPVKSVEAESVAVIYEKAAAIFYPQQPQALRRLGREQALNDLKGIYRVLLKIFEIPSIVQKTAQLWRTYHTQGNAFIDFDPSFKKATLTVKNYLNMPETFLETISGYLQGILELAGAKNSAVQPSRVNGDVQWEISWQ